MADSEHHPPSPLVEALRQQEGSTTQFPHDIDVAIVAHNNLRELSRAIVSLIGAGCPLDRITVVDVASDDGTDVWLSQDCPSVRVIRLTKNTGPGPGRNIGITGATRRFVLLMDADVRVMSDAIARLHAAMLADSTIKIGSPIVVHADAPDRIQYAGGWLHYICEAVNPWLDRPVAERGSTAEDIGVAPTCALLLEREAAIAVGLFDERYFIGKEDGDFTHRMKIAGHRIWEVPQAIVVHQSRPRNAWLFYYQIRNRWHFILKNYQALTLVCLIPPLFIYEPLQLAVLVAKGHGWTYLRAVAGLIAMLPALPRDRARVNRIRRRSDRELLTSGPLIVRGDLAANVLVRHGKGRYERFLNRYWHLLTRTVRT